jgi:hypothetical protein
MGGAELFDSWLYIEQSDNSVSEAVFCWLDVQEKIICVNMANDESETAISSQFYSDSHFSK